MNPSLRACLLLALLASPVARAGEFSTNCSFVTDALATCGDVFADVVTEEFTRRFPADEYELFVYSNVEETGSGELFANAVAGVVLRGSNDFPRRRFQSSRIRLKGEFTPGKLDEHELSVARDAVAWLMEKCGETPACDVYFAWDSDAPAVEAGGGAPPR